MKASKRTLRRLGLPPSWFRVSKRPIKGSRVGNDLVEAFQEMAAHLCDELELEGYELPK